MERTPRKYEYLEFESERLEIDAPCVVRVFKHGRRARIEVQGYLKEPVLTKKPENQKGSDSYGNEADR